MVVSLDNFLGTVSKQREEKVKFFRSDNALEYISEEFESILERNHIEHQFSVPYSPKQNGKAERMNRTLQDMVRCMLDQAKLPKSLWAEAVRTAAYLRNRLPTKVLQNGTPYEVWTGNHPKLDHLKVFGCVCYAHLSEAQRKKKLDQRGVECLFMGYCPSMKAYRLLEKGTNRIRNAINVKFDEKSLLKADEQSVSNNIMGSLEHVHDIPIPDGYDGAIGSDYSQEWIHAMQEEYNSLIENNT